MKVIIAGSRNITSLNVVRKALDDSGFNVTEIVSGCARGVDTIGEIIAKERGIPVKKFPAKWDELGKKAGVVRNTEMGDYADALVAISLNQSKGTRHMVNYMVNNKSKPTFFVEITHKVECNLYNGVN